MQQILSGKQDVQQTTEQQAQLQRHTALHTPLKQPSCQQFRTPQLHQHLQKVLAQVEHMGLMLQHQQLLQKETSQARRAQAPGLARPQKLRDPCYK